MSCPHDSLRYEERDCGVDRETGYRDAGERWTCEFCGAVFDAEELAGEMAAIERERELVHG